MKLFLHVGCGLKRKNQTTRGFNSDSWNEVRLDIDPAVKPDCLGSMIDMSTISPGSVDAIFSSHNIEHLYPHEVPLALGEFLRVLAPDGFAVITCPDLQSVCELVANDKLTEPAYISPAGPIAPIDIIYGFRPSLLKGNFFMAHRCGFTRKVLESTLSSSGFKSLATVRRKAPYYDLWVIATKSQVEESKLKDLVSEHFPI